MIIFTRDSLVQPRCTAAEERCLNGDELDADLPETRRHSFIIRIWLDAVQASGERAVWRGSISHVPDGEQRTINSLDAIPRFIAPYLQDMGVRLGIRWQLKRKFELWSQRLNAWAFNSSVDKHS